MRSGCREVVGLRMVGQGWRAMLSCGHEDEATHATRTGSFRFCAFCKMRRRVIRPTALSDVNRMVSDRRTLSEPLA